MRTIGIEFLHVRSPFRARKRQARLPVIAEFLDRADGKRERGEGATIGRVRRLDTSVCPVLGGHLVAFQAEARTQLPGRVCQTVCERTEAGRVGRTRDRQEGFVAVHGEVGKTASDAHHAFKALAIIKGDVDTPVPALVREGRPGYAVIVFRVVIVGYSQLVLDALDGLERLVGRAGDVPATLV